MQLTVAFYKQQAAMFVHGLSIFAILSVAKFKNILASLWMQAHFIALCIFKISKYSLKPLGEALCWLNIMKGSRNCICYNDNLQYLHKNVFEYIVTSLKYTVNLTDFMSKPKTNCKFHNKL